MEMRCYRKIPHISYKDHVTNEEVRAKIQQAIGPHEDLLAIVKRRKLQWYGHVSRSSDLAKTILRGTVKGAKRHGRQRKRWEDNIREWAGLEFAKSQKATEQNENLLTIVKRRKLHWYGHVSLSSGLAKTILQGTVKGGRRQGRQKKRREDNIRPGVR